MMRAPHASAASEDDDEAQAMLQPLNSMLNWGVANSDPEELKRVAKMVCFLLHSHVCWLTAADPGARRHSPPQQL